MKRLVGSLAHFKKMEDQLLLTFLRSLANLLNLDKQNDIYDPRMGPGYGTVKLVFEECGGVEVLEKV